ncbi:hypothetical protein [Dielma fastidiosa]|uniref:Uncharacterized protein n=1 Tax=Dielma fastidiosa TaxID=1034346 RepID=A0A318KM74_9FIRM|nr:hypothetical protein [Dielma fastidiosa]PXX77808.1 hypothetical protein DES51_10960 [Dielma fastidiosa]
MGKLLKKLGAFFVAMTMVVTMFPSVIQAAETANTWTEDGKNAVEGIDYYIVTHESSNSVKEFHVNTARGLGFFAYAMSQFHAQAQGESTLYTGFDSADIYLEKNLNLGGKNWVGLDGLKEVSDATTYDYKSFYYATLGRNLDDFSNEYYFATGYASGDWYSFKGSFIGNGHTISNLTIQRNFSGSSDGDTKIDNNRIDWNGWSNGMASYFLLNLGSEEVFKDVTFNNINVVILDQQTGNASSDAIGFAMVMENHGTVSNVNVKGNVSILAPNPAYYGFSAINRGTIEKTNMDVNVDLILDVNRMINNGNAYTTGIGLYGLKYEGNSDGNGDSSNRNTYFNITWNSTVALVSGIAAVSGDGDIGHKSMHGNSFIKDCTVKGNYNFYQIPKTLENGINVQTEDELTYDSVTFDKLKAFKSTLPMLEYADSNQEIQLVVTESGKNLVHGITAARYRVTIANSNSYDISIAAGESFTGVDGLLTKITDFNDMDYGDVNTDNVTNNLSAEKATVALTSTAIEMVELEKNTETFTSSVGGVIASNWTRFTDNEMTNNIEIPIYLQTFGESSYRVRLDWGNMEFIYDRGSWDAGTNSFKPENGNVLGWNGHDNVNNQILVTNQSNASVNAKLDLALKVEKGLSTEIYKEAGANTNTSEKDYTGKSQYVLGAYQAIGVNENNVQEFYVVLGGDPKGKYTNSTKIGSLTVTITSESISEASSQAITYLNNTTTSSYAATDDIQLSAVELGADKSITVADGKAVTLLGAFDANNHKLTLSNGSAGAKLVIDPSLILKCTKVQDILSVNGLSVEGITKLKQNGLIWKDNSGNVIDGTNDVLTAGDYTLTYLGSLDTHLTSESTDPYMICSDTTINAVEITSDKTLIIKDNAEVTITGTLSGVGSLKIAAGSEGSVVYDSNTYVGNSNQNVTIQ